MKRLLPLVLFLYACGGGSGEKSFLYKVNTSDSSKVADGRCSIREAIDRDRDCQAIPYYRNEIALEVPVYIADPPLRLPYNLFITGQSIFHAFAWNADRPLIYIPENAVVELQVNVYGIIHNDGTLYLCRDCQVWSITGRGKTIRF